MPASQRSQATLGGLQLSRMNQAAGRSRSRASSADALRTKTASLSTKLTCGSRTKAGSHMWSLWYVYFLAGSDSASSRAGRSRQTTPVAFQARRPGDARVSAPARSTSFTWRSLRPCTMTSGGSAGAVVSMSEQTCNAQRRASTSDSLALSASDAMHMDAKRARTTTGSSAPHNQERIAGCPPSQLTILSENTNVMPST